MTLRALAFAAGAALLQQQAQLPWLAWLVLLPLCIGLAVRVRPSGVPVENDAAQQSKLRAARGAAALRCCSPKISSASPRAKSFKPTSFLARMCCWCPTRAAAHPLNSSRPWRQRRPVVPVAHRNRVGHPNREVLDRDRAARAQILRTDLDGAVLVRLAATRIQVQTERRRCARYWLQ